MISINGSSNNRSSSQMPTFSHIFFALAVLIPILYFAREKFSYKLAFIYLISNIFGPDLVFLFSFLYEGLHSVIGFTIIAIPLSLVFSYISRFSIEKSNSKIPIKAVDSGIREINWIYAFCATAAGGFSHYFIDFFFHPELTTNIFPPIIISLDDMNEWSGVAYHTMNPIMVIGEAIVVLLILLSLIYLKKGFKETLIVFGIATVIELLLMLLIVPGFNGPEINGGEREYAAIFCIAIFIFTPSMLLFYAARNVNEKKPLTPDVSKMKPKSRLNIIAVVSLLLGIVMTAYGMATIFLTDIILEAVGDAVSATAMQLKILGIYYSIFAVLLLIGSIGLFFRSKMSRILVIIGACYFLIFGFSLGIAFFLCENEIRNLFHPLEPVKTE